jgi:two-component system LytT family sensor kinase
MQVNELYLQSAKAITDNAHFSAIFIHFAMQIPNCGNKSLIWHINFRRLKKDIIKYALGILVWIGCLLLVNKFLYSKIHVQEVTKATAMVIHIKIAFVSLVLKSTFIIVILAWFLPEFSRKRKFSTFLYKIFLWFLLCYCTEFTIPSFFMHYDSFQASIISLIHNPFWWFNLLLYVVLLSILFAYYFTKEWLRNEKLKREMIEVQYSTELKYLKNQVNPHFLFNTLNNLFSLAQKNKDEETANGISKLSGLMRYMLYDSSIAKVSLEKEIKNIQNYLGLEKLRHTNDEVIVNFTTAGDIENSAIAPMILLPFIENAFKHGINIEEVSTIDISITANEHEIIFTCNNRIVADNNMSTEKYGGIGLQNVRRRLELLYPNKHILKIEELNNTFTVYMQLIN